MQNTLLFLPCAICKQKQRTGESQSYVETDALTGAPLDLTSQGAACEWQPTS